MSILVSMRPRTDQVVIRVVEFQLFYGCVPEMKFLDVSSHRLSKNSCAFDDLKVGTIQVARGEGAICGMVLSGLGIHGIGMGRAGDDGSGSGLADA